MLSFFLVLVAVLASFVAGAMTEMVVEDCYRGRVLGFWYYLENATLGLIEDFFLLTGGFGR